LTFLLDWVVVYGLNFFPVNRVNLIKFFRFWKRSEWLHCILFVYEGFFFFSFSSDKIIIHKKKKKLEWEKGKQDLGDVSKTSFLCFLI
jgi:hypothetical protein